MMRYSHPCRAALAPAFQHACCSRRGLAMNHFSASVRMGIPAITAASTAVSPLLVQCRTQYSQTPGKRDQEAFLSQYDPMEVLGLHDDCTIEDIDKAFTEKAAKYGPKGQFPDAKMVDRVFRAHEILKDPDSPYYLKAHSSQFDRQRLQFQLLPKNKRRLIEFQVGILMTCALGLGVLLILLVLRPMKHSLRSATR